MTWQSDHPEWGITVRHLTSEEVEALKQERYAIVDPVGKTIKTVPGIFGDLGKYRIRDRIGDGGEGGLVEHWHSKGKLP